MTVTMYDAIPEEIPNIPNRPAAVAGYVDLLYRWSPADWGKFPNAEHLTIAASPHSRARCLDIERGDATPEQAPGWLLSLADHSKGLPVLYTSASQVDAVLAALRAHGISRSSVLIWAAHYTGRAHICGPGTCGYPQADGTQWNDTVNGRSCDVSLLSDRFFGPPPPVKPHGKARCELVFDLARLHWYPKDMHAPDVTHSPHDVWASVEVQFNMRTGAWRTRPLPWNARPLGGR